MAANEKTPEKAKPAAMFWPLMKDTVNAEDRKSLSDFVLTSERLTNGPKVREFEETWSRWQGAPQSLFVSSGSTANYLLLAAVMERYGIEPGSKVAVPAVTWSTNIAPVIQCGLEPVFCDVSRSHFGIETEDLKKAAKKHGDIKIVFVTHLFGIPAPVHEYREVLPDAVFLEDVCESHGTQVGGEKAGNLSEGSTFSFYFGHHMTTVEGGMVCSQDGHLHEIMRAKRSHGLARERGAEGFERFRNRYPEVDKEFLFSTGGFNFRNTEIGAVLGLSQIKRLDKFIERRREIFGRFTKMTWEKRPDLFSSFDTEGNSSYCLPFVCKTREMRGKMQKYMTENGVETRPLCGGNMLRQPFLEGRYGNPSDFPNADCLHYHGFFIGNNHLITDGETEKLEQLIDSFVKKL